MEALVLLTFLLAPVTDLASALPFYRDVLGLDEAWREGQDTVAFHLPDGRAQVMLVQGEDDPAGPMYLVDSVAAWFDEHPQIEAAIPTRPIPGGSVAGFRDPAGNIAYVFDQPDA